MKYTQNIYTPRLVNDIVGRRVKLYRNLHKKGVVYSLKSRIGGKENVVGYADDILLADIEFRVVQGTPEGKSGRAYVLRTGLKDVHAYVIGRVVSVDDAEIARLYEEIGNEKPWEAIRYNPKVFESFVRGADSMPIFSAQFARAYSKGVWAITDLPPVAQPNVSAAMRRKIVEEMDWW